MNKKTLFLLLIILLSINSFSQISFEKGYFVNNLNQKIECLIKNVDWKNNPTKFDYKLEEDSTIRTADINDVKEFSVKGFSKYVRALVNVDKSSKNPNELSSERNPKYQEEELYLKVLVEGLATLYLYENERVFYFLYKKNDSEINQLIYKKYLLNNHVYENEYFKQQLTNDLKNEQISSNNILNLKYSETDLTKIFIKYNQLSGTTYVNYNIKPVKDLFHISIRPGVNISHLSIKNVLTDILDMDYGTKVNLRFGIEAEYTLPFNNNTWSVMLEPTIQYYYSNAQIFNSTYAGNYIVTKIKYQSIELPAGLRYYIYQNKQSKIFADMACILDLTYKSTIDFSRIDGSNIDLYNVNSKPNFSIGVGYKINNRLSAEIKYQTKRQILNYYSNWTTDYRTVSFILGYTLF